MAEEEQKIIKKPFKGVSAPASMQQIVYLVLSCV
jgi:hypothetical protein